MRILSRTIRETFQELGQPLELELKAPSHKDAPRRLAAMARFNRRSRRKDELGEDDVAGFYEAMLEPDFVQFVSDSFAHHVRPIDLQDDRGNAIATGEQLLDAASHALVMKVLLRLQELCLPDAEMGKGSPSPSTSEAPSPSPATSTAPADGPTLSDATVPVEVVAPS